MKVMVHQTTQDSEAGVMPEQLLTEMGQYNEDLVKAGILLAVKDCIPVLRVRG